ncbi:AfsR/SARP family transcriptional regulator [Actinokineospora pegani]|uniref:AfsR/SARP family transcriptional regulator n=1 Tax=Actinokineospora pegani TaxID=2654637 RepID=UPI0012EB03A2|nr:AfsR/SARP family transcriptional regulator [Actinokineospora pegani]
MEYRVLGPLQVATAAGAFAPKAAKVKTLLATLLVRANEVVSLDQLQESMWGGHGPRSARTALHVYISQLRKFLGEQGAETSPVKTCAGGYLLEADPDGIDAFRAERLIGQGRRLLEAEDHTATTETLSTALGHWRGATLHGLHDSSVLRNAAIRLDELRVSAIEMRVEADLALGRDRHLIGELLTLVSEHPFREAFYRQLMIALYRSERQSEALRVYSQLRSTLNHELGLEPCRMLRSLQQAILRADQSLDPYFRHTAAAV